MHARRLRAWGRTAKMHALRRRTGFTRETKCIVVGLPAARSLVKTLLYGV